MNKMIRIVLVGFMLIVSMGCGSYEKNLDSIRWNPPTLSADECPDLSGMYFNGSMLYRFFQRGNDTRYHSPVIINNYREIPYVVVKRQMRTLPGQKPMSGVLTHKDTSAFDENAILVVRHLGQRLEATLTDRNGLSYKQVIRDLNHPLAGCDQGALVLRYMHYVGGGPGTPSTLRASEIRFTRLPDGRLQVVTHGRQWRPSFLGGGVEDPVTGRKDRQTGTRRLFDIVPSSSSTPTPMSPGAGPLPSRPVATPP